MRSITLLFLMFGFSACLCGAPEVDQDCETEQDCPSSSPICCGKLEFGPPVDGSCSVIRASSRCASSCEPSAIVTCESSSETPLCSGPSVCAPYPVAPRCCTFSNIAGSVSVCTNEAGAAEASSCLN